MDMDFLPAFPVTKLIMLRARATNAMIVLDFEAIRDRSDFRLMIMDVAIPADAEVMTSVIEWPAGSAGAPPHRHPGGPSFGYVLEGEMLFELEGEAPRVIKAGEAFWEPGGDVIHYSDANNRTDVPLRFLVTMVCAPGVPMLVVVDEEELEQRKDRRVPR